jgi:hypothetical protein
VHDRIGSVRVESHLRYFVGFRTRRNTRIEILLNESGKL